MAQHNEIGRIGEEKATAYILEKGYKILAKNYVFQKNEIDIIATIEDFIVFIEVKTRDAYGIADPKDAVNTKKITSIMSVANYFLEENDIKENARFDIISITYTSNKWKIEHLEDAFNSIY